MLLFFFCFIARIKFFLCLYYIKNWGGGRHMIEYLYGRQGKTKFGNHWFSSFVSSLLRFVLIKSHLTVISFVFVPFTHYCHTREGSDLTTFLSAWTSTGVGKLLPAGRMRPSRAFCAACKHFLKLCHLEINTTRGLTRRKSDGVLKKMVIASTLDGKCVRAYNCPQSGSYRLRKGEDLFFF